MTIEIERSELLGRSRHFLRDGAPLVLLRALQVLRQRTQPALALGEGRRGRTRLAPRRGRAQAVLQRRGDPEHHVVERLRKADDEEREGAVLADVVVINDDFERAVAEIQGIIGAARAERR